MYKGSCHCQSLVFEVKCSLDLAYLCDCSMCSRKGAKMVYTEKGDLSILSGKENLNVYRFNTNTAEHYFCKTCGIYTFHKTRALPGKFGVNSGCLEGVNPHTLPTKIIHGSER